MMRDKIAEASRSSVQPVLRDSKPLEFGRPHRGEEPPEEEVKDSAAPAEPSIDKGFTLDLMMMLDHENLATLKKQFAKFRNELDLFEFVAVMQQTLPHPTLSIKDQISLISNLKELFDQVDVNGDKRMEWAELTSFIVEAEHGGVLSETPLAKYKPITPVQDQTRVRSEQSIERIFYLPGLDRLLLCERPAPLVAVYSPTTAACIHELHGHRAEVLAVEHIPELACVVTAGADLSMIFWDVAGASPTWRMRQRASLQHSQLALLWLPSRRWLLAGGIDGCVSAWDVISLQVVARFVGHEDAVTSMIPMRHRKELIATGSLDKCIRLWDVAAAAPRCCHILGPYKGAHALPSAQHPLRERRASTAASSTAAAAAAAAAAAVTAAAATDAAAADAAAAATGEMSRVPTATTAHSSHGGGPATGAAATTSQAHERGVTCLAFSATHRHLFSGGLDHELLVWNPLSERCRHVD